MLSCLNSPKVFKLSPEQLGSQILEAFAPTIFKFNSPSYPDFSSLRLPKRYTDFHRKHIFLCFEVDPEFILLYNGTVS